MAMSELVGKAAEFDAVAGLLETPDEDVSLQARIIDLIVAGRRVIISRWESGDLAAAVRELDVVLRVFRSNEDILGI